MADEERVSKRKRSDSPEDASRSAAEKGEALRAALAKLSETRAGGAYVPPARLKALMAEVARADAGSVEYQRMNWEALRKSITGLVNKVAADNIKYIAPELFAGANLIRGRGLFCRSIMHAQELSLPFTPVFAALAAIVNTKLPFVGELLVIRLVSQFRRAFRRNDKIKCHATLLFLAHLVNQRVAHELLALEILVLLLENPTDDSVELAVAFMREVGAFLTEEAPKACHSVFDRFRSVLYEGQISVRVQYMVEVLAQTRKDRFQDHPSIPEALDLVEEEDQITHQVSLDDHLQLEEGLNVFKPDPDFEANEEKYRQIRAEILGEGSEDDDDDEEDEEAVSEADEAPTALEIQDRTETNLVNLRRTIYLVIMSSLDFEECVHKLLKLKVPEDQELELCNMVVECCSQERTYSKFYGHIGERLCKLHRRWSALYEQSFRTYYDTIHRYETNRLRNIARFFGALLATDAISWASFDVVYMNEDDTTSSSRIFIKILMNEMQSLLGLPALAARFREPSMQVYFEHMFPVDHPRNTRFSINFFTSIGLGLVTEPMREYLQHATQLMRERREAQERGSVSSMSDSDSSRPVVFEVVLEVVFSESPRPVVFEVVFSVVLAEPPRPVVLSIVLAEPSRPVVLSIVLAEPPRPVVFSVVLSIVLTEPPRPLVLSVVLTEPPRPVVFSIVLAEPPRPVVLSVVLTEPPRPVVFSVVLTEPSRPLVLSVVLAEPPRPLETPHTPPRSLALALAQSASIASRMSRRTHVRGPTSALSEFLASQGIRASEINAYGRQLRASTSRDEVTEASEPHARPRIAPGASLEFDEDDDAPLPPLPKRARGTPTHSPSAPTLVVRPGQPVECAQCRTPFTMTRYTRIEPGVGALCAQCHRHVPRTQVQAPRRARAAPARSGPSVGAVVDAAAELPSLQAICIHVAAAHIERVQAQRLLSDRSRQGLSRVISKNRQLTPRTLPLFVGAHVTQLRLYDCSALPSASYESLVRLTPHATCVQLQYCGQLNDAAFSTFVHWHALTEIDLFGPYLVRKEAWLAFLRARGASLTTLRVRETPRFDLACIEALVTHAPHLRELGLAQMGALDDDGVRALTGLAALHTLDVSQPGVSQPGVPPASLTDAGLVPLLDARGAQLRVLNLAQNDALTDATIERLAPCTTHLVADGLTNVSDGAWVRAARTLHALEHVSLVRCGVGDAVVCALAAHAPRLRVLRINSNDALTPAAFEALADAAPPLEELDIGFVRCIDDALLLRLVEAMPTLRRVYLFGCPGVVHGVSASYPHVTVVGRERR
ncbi:pre-mRNA-splicing factor cwc22 [Malassezia caprae]|uniref:Pre-mRNA-splicing factor cwc22 n=1 Tax=Malassezia caprae TaxID=1381934 RepID=A0AAF0EAA5_9BASI|nr:pre-mRNA-splicing factor cwc22 [Malassezia caprae]